MMTSLSHIERESNKAHELW